MTPYPVIHNGGTLPLADLQPLSYQELGEILAPLLTRGCRLVTCFADPGPNEDFPLSIYAVVAEDAANRLAVFRAVGEQALESLTPGCPQLHLFEREIGEQFGVVFKGHPWFKPVRFHAPWPGKTDAWNRDPAQWRGMRCMKSGWVLFMPASLSRVISGFNATGKRCCTWKFPWDTSTAVLNGSWPGGRGRRPLTGLRPPPVIRPWAT
jgi:hypothetical protein